MNKYLIPLPLPSDGINLLDASLISDYEAAEGTKNVSFKDGVAHTRHGYIKDNPYNFPVVPGSIYSFVKDSVNNILVACGTALKKKNADTYDDIVGTLNTDKIECLTYACALGLYDAPYNLALAFASGGTLVVGTYAYRVTALTANGESVPCAEVTITTTEVGSVALTWDKLSGVTGYKVYGRASGAELLIGTINSADTCTFTDDGSVTPTGAMPTENTTIQSAYGDKCFILDGNKFRYFESDLLLHDVPVYNPSAYEVEKYGTNVLIDAPDEVNKQKFIVNDNERIWLAGYGKIVRVAHLQRLDYFPSTQVWKLEEDCTGMARYMGEVMLFTENTAVLISGSTPDFTLSDHYVFTKLPEGYGCSQHRSIAEGNNAIYWANRNGVYRYRYLPSGYSIPECVSEFLASNTGGKGYHNRSIKEWISGITDWSKVHAEFYDNEYRLYMGNKQVAVFDTINQTWALYEYDQNFSCSMAHDGILYYAQSYLYHMDYHYDPVGDSYDGLSDDGIPIIQDLKSKFFDFGKAANKKKFKELYFTIYTPLISYNILLNLNLDNDYSQINNEIVNTVARMGELRFGDIMNCNETNLNYPVKIHHKGKKYNIQYELILSDLNTAFTLLSAVLSLKVKELK